MINNTNKNYLKQTFIQFILFRFEMLYDHRDHIRGEDSLYLIYDTETG